MRTNRWYLRVPFMVLAFNLYPFCLTRIQGVQQHYQNTVCTGHLVHPQVDFSFRHLWWRTTNHTRQILDFALQARWWLLRPRCQFPYPIVAKAADQLHRQFCAVLRENMFGRTRSSHVVSHKVSISRRYEENKCLHRFLLVSCIKSFFLRHCNCLSHALLPLSWSWNVSFPLPLICYFSGPNLGGRCVLETLHSVVNDMLRFIMPFCQHLLRCRNVINNYLYFWVVESGDEIEHFMHVFLQCINAYMLPVILVGWEVYTSRQWMKFHTCSMATMATTSEHILNTFTVLIQHHHKVFKSRPSCLSHDNSW